MQVVSHTIALFTILCLPNLSVSQSAESLLKNQVNYTPFKGVVYTMPVLEQKIGKLTKVAIQDYYNERVYTYDTICKITLDQLHFPESSIDKARFLGVRQKTNYAMLLHSQMTIPTKGCYAFELTSDDGSRLWIADTEILNNDGGHGMKSKKDTIQLNPSTYPIKVWYFQGMPDKYGFIFNGKYVGDESLCKVKTSKESTKSLVLNNVLFEVDDFMLTQLGIQEVKRIAGIIDSKPIQKIIITGHTDRSGSDTYNYNLSLRRAKSVETYLKSFLKKQDYQFISEGKGSSIPIDRSNNKESRAKNRRVEILIK